MSSAVRLPAELREFLGLPGPQSLVIRGPPGSGKSTLSLALLEAARGDRILVTSRVSPSELSREFSWLGENGNNGIRIVDASQPDAQLLESLHAAARASEILNGPSVDRKGVEEFLLLPPPIQEAWSQLGTHRPALVIVDSWDALVEQYLGARGASGANGVDRAEIERMLLRRMSRTPAHLVLVLERREESQLDYLVNGVVVTERERLNDRLERWLLIPKMRGIRVANASYPYTVESARFQCIEPVRAYGGIRPGRFEPEPDSMPNHLWPGSHGLAEAFGRLPIGKTTLIETDGDVPDFLVQLMLGPALAFTMSRRGHALLIPSPTLSAEEIWSTIASSVPRREIVDNLRILDVTGQLEAGAKQSRSELVPAILSARTLTVVKPGQPQDDNEVSRFVRGQGGDTFPSLAVAYLSGLSAISTSLKIPLTPEYLEAFPASVQTSLGSTRLHFIAIGRSGTPFFEPLRSLAEIHIHVRMRQGRAFLYGSKPWTPGYVVTEAPDGGPFDLLRIV